MTLGTPGSAVPGRWICAVCSRRDCDGPRHARAVKDSCPVGGPHGQRTGRSMRRDRPPSDRIHCEEGPTWAAASRAGRRTRRRGPRWTQTTSTSGSSPRRCGPRCPASSERESAGGRCAAVGGWRPAGPDPRLYGSAHEGPDRLTVLWTEMNRPTPTGAARCEVRMRWSLPWRSVAGQQQRCAFTFAFDEGREFGLGHAHGIRVVPAEPLQEFCCGQRSRNVAGEPSSPVCATWNEAAPHQGSSTRTRRRCRR